jgi:hypothetical protein
MTGSGIFRKVSARYSFALCRFAYASSLSSLKALASAVPIFALYSAAAASYLAAAAAYLHCASALSWRSFNAAKPKDGTSDDDRNPDPSRGRDAGAFARRS